VPGTTKPATPMTSFTFTEMARIPAVMVGGRPAPAAASATLDEVSGSFSTTDAMRPRFTTSSTVVYPPETGLPAGHATRRTSLGVSIVPTGRAFEATATW